MSGEYVEVDSLRLDPEPWLMSKNDMEEHKILIDWLFSLYVVIILEWTLYTQYILKCGHYRNRFFQESSIPVEDVLCMNGLKALVFTTFWRGGLSFTLYRQLDCPLPHNEGAVFFIWGISQPPLNSKIFHSPLWNSKFFQKPAQKNQKILEAPRSSESSHRKNVKRCKKNVKIGWIVMSVCIVEECFRTPFSKFRNGLKNGTYPNNTGYPNK